MNKKMLTHPVAILSSGSALLLILSSRLDFIKVSDTMSEYLVDALNQDVAIYKDVTLYVGLFILLVSIGAALRSSKILSFLPIFPYLVLSLGLFKGLPHILQLDDPLTQELGLLGYGIGYFGASIGIGLGLIGSVLGLFLYKKTKKEKVAK